MTITAEQLRDLLDYDPETGVFTWRKPTSRAYKPGDKPGRQGNHGYWYTTIRGKNYLAHRLAWLYVHGEWPPQQIDHINGDRLDNRIENLRLATNSQNNQNVSRKKSNTSGLKGVCWDKSRDKWSANIRVNGSKKTLGRFDCPAAASFAYQIAASDAHGEFAKREV